MLKENEIYNMDCLDGLRQIKTGSVQAIITDPPYFQGLTQNGTRGDFADLEITKPFWKALAREINRVLKPDGEFYIFMDWRGYAFYYPIFAEYLPVKNLIVWDKGAGPGSFYSYTHEFILYGTKNTGLRRGGSNVWRENGFSVGAAGTDGDKIHPAQKPVAIIERCLLDSTQEGDLVVDLFGGSCTTGVAAIRNNRRFICFEVKESTYDKARRRIALEKEKPSRVPRLKKTRRANGGATHHLACKGMNGPEGGTRNNGQQKRPQNPARNGRKKCQRRPGLDPDGALA